MSKVNKGVDMKKKFKIKTTWEVELVEVVEIEGEDMTELEDIAYDYGYDSDMITGEVTSVEVEYKVIE